MLVILSFLSFFPATVAKILYLILDDKATLRFAGDGKPDGFLSYKLKNQTKNFLTPPGLRKNLKKKEWYYMVMSKQDTNLFDGKRFAREKEERLREVVVEMKRKPRMVSFLVGEDPASKLYTKLKQKAAERVGVGYWVLDVGNWTSVEELRSLIKKESNKYDGVMVQLPLPSELRSRTNEVLEAIPLNKDVDGLRWEESGMVPATVKAVLSILKEIGKREKDLWQRKFVVVGSRGVVGRPLMVWLKKEGVKDLNEVEIETPEEERMKLLKQAEVLISCVGQPELIKAEEVSEGLVAVDVGISSKELEVRGKKIRNKVVGDMERGVYEKAGVAVPVPGGVGPVTIVSLLENLVGMVYGSPFSVNRVR